MGTPQLPPGCSPSLRHVRSPLAAHGTDSPCAEEFLGPALAQVHQDQNQSSGWDPAFGGLRKCPPNPPLPPGGLGSPKPQRTNTAATAATSWLGWSRCLDCPREPVTGQSRGKAAPPTPPPHPALLHSLTSLRLHHHPAGPGSGDLHVRSLFQTWGAPCLHGTLARLQAALPAPAAAHRQASLPTSPRPCCG